MPVRQRPEVQEVLREGFVSGPETATQAPWYAEGLCFTCTQCGNCCGGAPGYVFVNQAEVAAIADFVHMTFEDFMRRHVRRCGRALGLLELPNGDCEFLEHIGEGKTRCRIHPVRPVQCGTWPFWKSNLETPEDWKQAGKGCPGIDKGRHHPLPVIQAALKNNGRRPL